MATNPVTIPSAPASEPQTDAPQPLQGPVASASRAVSLGCLWFAGLGLVTMTAIIGWQVFARYVLNASPSWSEQAALLLMIWYVLFAAAAGVREGFHIRISIGADNLPGQARLAAHIAAHGVVAAVGLAMLVWGADLVGRTWSHTIPTLGLPRGTAYIPLPIAGALITAFSLEHIWARLRGKRVEPLWN